MGIRPRLRAAGTIILLVGCALLAACSVFGGRAGYGLPPAPLLPDDLASLSCDDLQTLYNRLDNLLYDIEEDAYDFGDPAGVLESKYRSVEKEQDQVEEVMAQKCGRRRLVLNNLLARSGILVGGYVDASYIAGFNKGKDLAYREFDGNNNTFSLNQAALQINYLGKIDYEGKETFGVKATMLTGEDAKVINRILDGSYYSYGSTSSSSSNSTFALPEGYLQYNWGKLHLQGGRVLAIDSLETIYAPANDNISRGLQFTWSPQLLTGGRVSYDVCPHYTVFGGVYNSSYGYSQDNNKPKAFEAGGTYYGGGPLSGSWSDLYSVEGNGSDQIKTNYFGAYMNFQPGGPVKLGAAVDWTRAWGMTQSTTIVGGGVYADYKLMPKLDLAGRAEYFSTRNALGTCNKPDGKCDIGELTTTLNYKPTPHFKLQFEFRYDTGAGSQLFPDPGYSYSTTKFSNHDTELGLQASYHFGYFSPRF